MNAPTPILDLERGTLQLTDHDGRVIDYVVELDRDADGWGVILRRVDCEAGPYHVGRQPGRMWHCDCQSFRFRKGPYAPYGCKHTHSVRNLFALVERLQPRENHVESKAR